MPAELNIFNKDERVKVALSGRVYNVEKNREYADHSRIILGASSHPHSNREPHRRPVFLKKHLSID
ncbi:MAG: hypothetical protein QW327_00770 [Candidatus Odinarchaeota archaeon]